MSNCQSLKEIVSFAQPAYFSSTRQVGQMGESLVMCVEAKQPLEEAGKNGWKMADFSVMMIAVDLGP
ncbi:hypothetical protein TNCV_4609361 [Trichonephila clavipes]|nr:hypothetical protein TNCV_4609361 [Trichonephila clavipes]